MKKKLLFGVGAIIVSMVVYETCSNTLDVTMRDKHFEIPNRYVFSSPLLELLKTNDSFDDSANELLIEIPAVEIQQAFSEYEVVQQGYDVMVPADLNFIFSEMSDRNNETVNSSKNYEEIWYRTGRWRNQVSEFDVETGYWKVYSTEKYKDSWMFMSIKPEPSEPLPTPDYKYFLADCGVDSTTYDIPSYTCLSHFTFDNIYVSYHVPEENVKHITKINLYIEKKIRSWLHE